ncbi:Mitochondrial import inner membrane translocase subunit Tim16 [Clonorchis sinensis]|uniref:Mitochondrial import inner membrane translocase subunit Tim16 n=1 Tax=Clonorchis sinensis TaxID=79923 RepID=A0A8T1MB48_CLOSI|nr:Mitochondrial import inner membrane translocase subunit Tim16 [Clonorchis sinensis]
MGTDFKAGAAKYIAQLIISGARVLGRAFTHALKEEYVASQQAANARRSQSASGDTSSQRTFDQITGMSLDEAKQILNVRDINDAEALRKNYDHLFSVNAKEKGGSLYLQSKRLYCYSSEWGVRRPKWLERELTDRKVRGSNPTSAS